MSPRPVRKRVNAAIAVAIVALAVAWFGAGTASAAATICEGSLFGAVSGNVVVPAGAGCTMSATVAAT
jgi:hypothetical protein